MISRIWHGWTSKQNAATYESLLRTKILPGIHRVAGFQGAYLLRRDAEEEIEFVTITMFESMESVKAFAGDDFSVAVVPPEAQKLLAHYDARSVHYDVVMAPGA